MEPGVIMATQNFKRNLFLNLYRGGGKKNITLVCFLLLLKREIKNVTLAAYFLRLETPDFPACYPLKGGGNTFKFILRGQNYPNTNDRYNHYKKRKITDQYL